MNLSAGSAVLFLTVEKVSCALCLGRGPEWLETTQQTIRGERAQVTGVVSYHLNGPVRNWLTRW
jgi:hypothetical protein